MATGTQRSYEYKNLLYHPAVTTKDNLSISRVAFDHLPGNSFLQQLCESHFLHVLMVMMK